MLSRRTFLQLSFAGLAGATVPEAFGAASKRAHRTEPISTKSAITHHPLGVQLYTIREDIDKNLPALLKAISKIGYKEVELFGPVYNRPATEVRKLLVDNGLTAPSGHFGYDVLESKLDYAEELGLKYVICPMLPREMWNERGFADASSQLNEWGAELRHRGIRFGYHNHNYEFKDLGGKTGFDVLMEQTDPKLCYLELDCYWLAQAGKDAAAVIRQYPDRVRLLHLKDRKPGFSVSQELDDSARHFTEVGAGTLDWKGVLAAAKEVGVEHLIVERDGGDLAPLDSLKISFANLLKLT